VIKVLRKKESGRNDIQMVCPDMMVPRDHLLRKIDTVIDDEYIHGLVDGLYSGDKGRPSVDPVVLIKMILIQHLYGIRSIRQTVKEIEMNIAYRWFLGYGISEPIPHFSTVSYALVHRFTDETFEAIFTNILEKAIKYEFVDASSIFIDATHIKANANVNKSHKEMARETARIYDEQMLEEINTLRRRKGKKPFKREDDKNDGNTADPENTKTRKTTVSDTDPESGLFHKGEHKVVFAYTAHTACDKKNFVLGFEVTPGNVHDSKVFDPVYDKVSQHFPEVEIVAMDSAYKTPWICKKVIDDGRIPSTPYRAPNGRKGFFRPKDFVYDEYYDCVLCPNGQVLQYSTTNRDGYSEYRSDPEVCKNCPYLSKCTTSKTHQKIVTRHIWQKYMEKAEDIRLSPVGKESYRMRSQTIERVFADAKEKHGMRYTQHRGLAAVKKWICLKYAAMNLKKMAVWAWKGSNYPLNYLLDHIRTVLFQLKAAFSRKMGLSVG
jgi:transposase